MSGDLSKRAFLVGCGRSGTTLLTALLGAHRDIKTFPESWFFVGLIGQKDSRTLDPSEVPISKRIGRVATSARIRLGVSNRAGVAHWLPEFLEKIGRPELFDEFPHDSPTISSQIAAFVALLDRLTLEDNKKFWIEKTPHHIYYMDVIDKYVKPRKYIHIVRNGPDVVASYYDAGKKHPDVWGYYTDSLDRCINAWNHALPFTQRCLGRPGHMAVSYEQLVEDTPFVMEKVCAFLETDYDPDMCGKYAASAKFVAAGEPWKDNVSDKIASASKFKEILSPEQQAYVLERLIKVDTSRFYLR